MAQKHLQLLRNGSAYTDYQAAYQALITKTTYADGTPILARYSGTTGEIKTLLGVVNRAEGVGARVDIINDVQASILRDYNLEPATSGDIRTNDSIEVALNKLENQVQAAKAAATTKVVEGDDEGNNMTITPTTGANDSVTYTVSLTDVASKSALDAEIAARKAVDGQDGQTYVANTGVNYIGDATSLNNADVKLDTAVASLSGKVDNLNYDLAKDDNKVVVSLNQTNGKISGTSENITSVKLANYTVGGDDSGKIAATDTLGEALGKLQGQINGMDKSASAVDGQVVTTVAETDGKVTETKANVKDLQLGGYAKDDSATGAISGTDTINTALSKLENTVTANKIANVDGSINVTTGTNGTDINVNIKSGEHVLAKNGNAGLYTDLDFVKITTGLPETVKERYQLLATDDSQIGANIDIPKDSHIVSITYITDSSDTHYQNLEYKYIDASGTTQTTYVDMSSLVLETEFASGVTAVNGIVRGVVDLTSESFLTVGADGFKLSGVQNAIDSAIVALDVTGDTAVAGQYVAAIEENSGLVAVKARANVSEAVLNNYRKGTDATTVAATDTVNQAISKLENQIDGVKDGYLSGVTVNGVTGAVANNVATVEISGSSIHLGTSYTGSESGAPTTADTVNAAIAKLYNKSNANASSGKTITITSGESSTNFEVNVDNTTTATAEMALYESANHNAIQDTTNGLYVSSIWDCGTYDAPAGN